MMQPLQTGDPRAIGPYTLLGRLGSGGMGRVYLGRSPGGRTVAVKAVHPHFATDDQFRARFRREVEAARRVGGAWTAPVLDAGPEADVPWVATGYVAGTALSDAVEAHGPLPPEAARALGAGLAEALTAVHALGLVHRDVKPSNVLLTLDGPRLIDFGIARATDGTASLTATGVSVGSPGYMSPEQILGRGAAGPSDVFSLGAVLVYAATGQPPFTGDSAPSLLYQVVNEDAQLHGLPGIDPVLAEVATACLAKDPDARPAPAALAGRLAPGGAAALMGAGWLPAPVSDGISRAAIELLGLEAHPAPEPSGPVPLPRAEYGPSYGFGPPPSLVDTAGNASGNGHTPAAGGGWPTPPGAVPPPGNGSWGNTSHGAGVVQDARPADAPTAQPAVRSAELGWRGRRASCTLVLSVAGAAAVAMLGLYLSGVLKDDGSRDNASSNDTTATPTAPAATSAQPSAQPSPEDTPDPTAAPAGKDLAQVPESFQGTWKGTALNSDGSPNGDLTLVVDSGRKGSVVTHTTFSVLSVACHSKGELTKATDDKMLLAETTDTAKPQTDWACTGNPSNVTLTLDGDKLLYYNDDPAGGRTPTTLTKE
ncbi:serine/threonine-protein kinase [Streptomyces sp. NPDC051940]|uniref:serine/threonine-protein kinase n=1 Tax=Streptomyces sp. NPDC051940 TaxID=3155675 RepID=UPI00341C8341